MEKTLRKPLWLKSEILSGGKSTLVVSKLRSSTLNTVCEEAKCPNRGECWRHGTATFILMGNVCTRNCLFCSIQSGRTGQELDLQEPKNVTQAAKEMGLKYVVLTSVDRDDLEDLGAGHFAECIKEVKKSGARVEALIPDFQGRKDCLEKIVRAKPNVIGHNIEVVERLQGIARDPRASYKQSIKLLHNIKAFNPEIKTKSSIMLGLGETREEVLQVMDDLREVECDFLTLGQYLQASKKNLLVHEYIEPEVFEELKKAGLEKGFGFVASGPLVRSSFKAGEFFEGKRDL
ncbi:MAG: lipoyl synthase [archaeon]|jgi:lipoic acid synthetase|nr:lipoyl synthase [archaeon]